MSYMSWEDLERTYTEMYNRIETNDEGEITMRTVVEHIKGVEAGDFVLRGDARFEAHVLNARGLNGLISL